MKYIIFISTFALIIVGLCSAQVSDEKERTLATELIARSETLKSNIKQYLNEHAQQEYLLDALEHELILLEGLTEMLRKPNLTTPSYSEWLHYVHVIEEELFHHENRVAEELAILKSVVSNPIDLTRSIHQLVSDARDLISKAQTVINKYPTTKEVSLVKHEIEQLELMIILLESPLEKDSFKLEQELLRHDGTLQNLLIRITKGKAV